MREIYVNPRAHRVRIAQAAIWLGGAVIAWLGLFDQSGHVGSEAELIFVRVMGVAAIATIIAFEFYLRAYVLRIVREVGVLEITTLATLHHRVVRFDPAEAALGETRHETSVGPAPRVNAFWTPLRLPGRNFTFILDETPPARLDHAALRSALRARA